MRIRELIPWRSPEREQLTRRSHDPFTMLQTEMNRLFNDFFEGFDLRPGGSRNEGALGMPKVDVSETEDAVHVTAELPGMKQEDVDVTLSDGHLVLRGEKKSETQDQQKNYHRVERSYGTFERSILLPAAVDDKKVEASFKNGVLEIVLPKVEGAAAAGKKIPVRRLN
jgi:HSP20 family protein